MIRCKFRVTKITQYENGPDAKEVTMCPCMHESFGKYTPAGEIRMLLANPEAAKQMELGKEYFVDFTPAE